MTEKQFLIKLIVVAFNNQFGRNLNPANFDIFSITPNNFSDLAYEVYSVSSADQLRIRSYLTIGAYDGLRSFRLNTDENERVNQLGDEVYVADGSLSKSGIAARSFRLNWITNTNTSDFSILLEDGTPILLEDGSELLLEAA